MIDKENYNVIFQGLDKFFDSSESINTKKKVYGQFEGREFIVNQKSSPDKVIIPNIIFNKYVKVYLKSRLRTEKKFAVVQKKYYRQVSRIIKKIQDSSFTNRFEPRFGNQGKELEQDFLPMPEFDQQDFEGIRGLLNRSNRPVNKESSRNKSIDRMIYQEHSIGKGMKSKKVKRELYYDLKRHAKTKNLAKKIIESPYFIFSHKISHYPGTPQKRRVWVSIFMNQVKNLNNGDYFLWDISPRSVRHALYAKVEKDVNGVLSLAIGNAGPGGSDFRLRDIVNGLRYTQNVVLFSNVSFDYEKLKLFIILLSKKVDALDDSKSLQISLIDEVYAFIANNFGGPVTLNYHKYPAYWGAPQLGSSCVATSFWVLSKIILPKEHTRKFKNIMRLKILHEDFRLYKADKNQNNHRVPYMLDVICKVRQVLLTRYPELSNEYIRLMGQMEAFINRSERSHFISRKMDIEDFEIEQLESLTLSCIGLKCLSIYKYIIANDFYGLLQSLISLDVDEFVSQLIKINESEADELLVLYKKITISKKYYLTRLERLGILLVLDIVDLLIEQSSDPLQKIYDVKFVAKYRFKGRYLIKDSYFSTSNPVYKLRQSLSIYLKNA